MKKRILWAVGIVLLGILGSALWELVFRPGFWVVGRGVLSVTSLGAESFRNDLYEEVAKGHHNLASLRVLLALAGVIVALPIVMILEWRRATRGEDFENESDYEVSDVGEVEKQIAALERKGSELRVKLYIVSFLAIVCAATFVVTSLKTSYINLAVTHFEQSLAICRPYLTNAEEEEISGRFA